MFNGVSNALPGPGTPTLGNEEAPISWGPDSGRLLVNGLIDSATVDARVSPTTDLQPGLLLGKVGSTGRLKQYDPTATDGTDRVFGVLYVPARMATSNGNTYHQTAGVLIAGPVNPSALGGLDNQARAQMRGRFLFSDDPAGVAGLSDFPRVVAKTGDYTVTAADSGTTFTNEGASGAVIFTLPAVDKGLRYRFAIEANQNVTITAPSGKLVAFNNATATSIAFTTSNEKIGAVVEVIPNASATKWIAVVHLGAESQTPTVS